MLDKDVFCVYHICIYDDLSKGYIGVTNNMTKRFSSHKKTTRNENVRMYIDKHGLSKEDVKILLYGSYKFCMMMERKLRPEMYVGLNIAKGGGGGQSGKNHYLYNYEANRYCKCGKSLSSIRKKMCMACRVELYRTEPSRSALNLYAVKKIATGEILRDIPNLRQWCRDVFDDDYCHCVFRRIRKTKREGFFDIKDGNKLSCFEYKGWTTMEDDFVDYWCEKATSPCIINGKEYMDITSATIDLGMSVNQVSHRLKSSKYKEWVRLKGKVAVFNKSGFLRLADK